MNSHLKKKTEKTASKTSAKEKEIWYRFILHLFEIIMLIDNIIKILSIQMFQILIKVRKFVSLNLKL